MLVEVVHHGLIPEAPRAIRVNPAALLEAEVHVDDRRALLPGRALALELSNLAHDVDEAREGRAGLRLLVIGVGDVLLADRRRDGLLEHNDRVQHVLNLRQDESPVEARIEAGAHCRCSLPEYLFPAISRDGP